MADEKIIKVKIENTVRVEGGAQSPEQSITSETVPAKNVDNLAKNAKNGNSLAKSLAVQYGKQVANYALSNYGNLTGDYAGQRSINAGIELAGMALTIAANPIFGGITAGLTIATKVGEYYLERAKHDLQVSQLRERTQTLSY